MVSRGAAEADVTVCGAGARATGRGGGLKASGPRSQCRPCSTRPGRRRPVPRPPVCSIGQVAHVRNRSARPGADGEGAGLRARTRGCGRSTGAGTQGTEPEGRHPSTLTGATSRVGDRWPAAGGRRSRTTARGRRPTWRPADGSSGSPSRPTYRAAATAAAGRDGLREAAGPDIGEQGRWPGRAAESCGRQARPRAIRRNSERSMSKAAAFAVQAARGAR